MQKQALVGRRSPLGYRIKTGLETECRINRLLVNQEAQNHEGQRGPEQK
jgi:hypothetical protein